MSNQFKPGDWSELKQKALAASDEFGSYDPAEAEIKFMSAISPGVVLALIAENEQLREDHDKQWRLAQSGIQNTEAVLAENAKLRAEVEALRRDAERYRFVRELAWYVDQAAYVYEVGNSRSLWSSERESVDADDVEEAIDAAMGNGGRADG